MSAPLLLDRIRQDLAFAWRGLRRAPAFTAGVVITLGLGIGVNAAVFSFLDPIFLQPPAGVARANEVRRVYTDHAGRVDNPGNRVVSDVVSYPYVRAIAAAQDPSVELAAFTEPESTTAVVRERHHPIRRSLVGGEYFRVLGVRPRYGRFFTGDEAAIESPTPVAVLSDAFRRRAFGDDERVVGATITIRNRPFTVIGVAAAPFSGIDLDAVDVWVPANTYEPAASSREPWYETSRSSLHVIARLPRGMSEAQVSTAATTAMRSVHLPRLRYDSTQTARLGSILRANGPAHRAQELSIAARLAGVAFLVLLIACANVANLFLVRASRRRREIALRRALGVSARRLYAQVLTESVLHGVLAGLVGVALAFWAATALRRLLLPRVQWADAPIDLRTIGFVAVTSLLAGVLAGLATAIQANRPDLMNCLKAGMSEGSYRPSRLRSTLLTVQTALSVVLLVGAGLFVRSLDNVRRIDVGFDIAHTLSITPDFGGHSPSPAEVRGSMQLVLDRIRSAPGVEAAGLASSAPMRGYSGIPFFIPGHDSVPAFPRGPSTIAVSPDYFRAAGIPLLAGREFGPEDRRGGIGAIIVSRALARRYWPNGSAIGACVKIGERDAPCSRIVGIVGDANRVRMIEAPSLQFYRPLAQVDVSQAPRAFVIRIDPRNAAAVTELTSVELQRALPGVASVTALTLEQQVAPQLRPWRLGAQLFTALGVLALVVAAVGMYSVVAYAVGQRTREMGIRLALGARAGDVLSLVVGEGSRMVLLGVALGLAAALLAGRFVAALLFGVSAHDPFVLAGTALLLALVGVVASALPAWRATKVDPVAALRAE